MSNKLYDVLKWISVILIPALTWFLGTILPVLKVDAEIVNVVVVCIGAFGTFIGALIGVSTIKYNKKIEQKEE